MKVFTSKQFIDKLYWLANKVRNKYYSGKLWLTYDKSDDKFRMDCVLSVKGILWGFSANKNVYRGGAVYCSNGVADFTCNGGLTEHCTDISQDFSKIIPGEYLCMKGTKYNHTGIYLGNGKVFEDTTGWGVNRAIISDISKDGTRSYNGKKLLKWTYHGKLKYIDYSESPTPTIEWKYQSHDMVKGYWLPEVLVNSNGYAGNFGHAMDGFRCQNCEIRGYDLVKKKWLPVISSYKEYVGNLGHALGGIAMKSLDSKIRIKYRTHLKVSNRWQPWVTGYDINDFKNGFAGNLNETLDGIQVAFIEIK